MESSSHVENNNNNNNNSFATIELVDRNDDRLPSNKNGIEKQHLDPTCFVSIPNYHASNSTTPKQLNASTSNCSGHNTIHHTPPSSIRQLSDNNYNRSTDFHTPNNSTHNFNETNNNNQSRTLGSVYQTCVEFPLSFLKRSRSIRQTIRRSSLSNLFDKIVKSPRLSIVRGESINIEGNQKTCTCRSDFTDGNCLKNFMEMSVQPAEYRNNTQQVMTSTPILSKNVDYDQSIFNVARVKRVELHDLKPKVPEIHVYETPSKDLCINNNNVHTPNGNFYNQQHQQQQQQQQQQSNVVGKLIENVAPTGPLRSKAQLIANAMTKQTLEDGNVLKKVISFTLEQMSNGDNNSNNNQTTNNICKISRPNFVPQKLRFSEYNQFEGQMLVKWISSSITKTHNLNENDLLAIERLVAVICTHLIEAGVMKQIVDNNENVQCAFCPYQMYQWTYADPYHDNRPKKPSNQNGVNGENSDEIDSISSNETIKSQILACDSVNSIMAEMKGGALNEIESYTDTDTHNKSELKRCEPLNGVHSVDHDDVKIEFKSTAEFCKNCLMKQQNICDSQMEHSSVDKNTQTESVSTEVNVQPSIAIPPPPPLPNFLMSSTIPSIAVKEAKETISTQMEQQNNYSCAPQVMNSNAKTTNDKENVPCIPVNIPIAPPLPPITLSSASSFCTPSQTFPMSGGMPVPPPMPIPSDKNIWFKSDTLRKAAKHPKKPMISLFWTRIIAPKPEEDEISKCAEAAKEGKKNRELWQDIDETIIENVDEFGELFSRSSTPKKIKESVKIPRKVCIKVLDSKRSQTVGIFAQNLHRLRIDAQAIEHAIYNWDTKNVALDLLQQMREHQASANELKLIKEAIVTRSDVPLDGPERFLLNFSKISCASERIDCILFRIEFEEATGHIERKIDTVRNLCEFLIENDPLKDLFSIILTLGNFMNGGNRVRGQADGFGLDVLNKLKDVKSKDKKITLLHYIVKTFINKRRQNGMKLKDIIYPVPSARDVKEACIIDFVDINEQICQLKNRLADFQRKMQIVIESSNASIIQPFKEISEMFVKMAKKEVEQQCDKLIACKQLFRETLEFFHHSPKTGTIDDCTPGQFFELWSMFAVDFQDLWKREFAAINAELVQKYKSVTAPRASMDRKQKPTGLRARRTNQI